MKRNECEFSLVYQGEKEEGRNILLSDTDRPTCGKISQIVEEIEFYLKHGGKPLEVVRLRGHVK